MLKAALTIAVADLILNGIGFVAAPFWKPFYGTEFFLTCVLTALVAVAFLRHGRAKAATPTTRKNA